MKKAFRRVLTVSGALMCLCSMSPRTDAAMFTELAEIAPRTARTGLAVASVIVGLVNAGVWTEDQGNKLVKALCKAALELEAN